MKKDIVKFPHVADGKSFKKVSVKQVDLIGEGILKTSGAEFMRKNL